MKVESEWEVIGDQELSRVDELIVAEEVEFRSPESSSVAPNG